MRKKIYLISLILWGLLYQNVNGQVCPDLICVETLHVAVDNNCEAEIIPEDFVLPDCISNNYQITISDLAGDPVLNPVTSEYLYTDLVIEFISFDLDDTCTTNLIVEDRMPPVINSVTGPAIITCLSNLDEEFTVDATDNCDFLTEITYNAYPCQDCSVIPVDITWTVTDRGNNQDSYTLTVDLVDYWDVITWPSDFVIACEGDLPTSPFPVINEQPGCDREFIIEHYDYRTGCSINRVWFITDLGSGLQTSHTQHILIHDIVEPVIIAPDVVHLTLDEYNAGWSLDYEVVDDCTVDPTTYMFWEIFRISCNPEYFKIIYTITATDDCGNQATSTTVVNVKSKLKSKVKLSGKKSCYSPFQIFTDVKNMSEPLSYAYSVNNLTWSVTDLGDGIALVNSGIGKVTITVVVSDHAGCKARSSIKFNCRKFVPKKRSIEYKEVNMYPNPTTGKLYITGDEIQKVLIFNMEGKLVKSFRNISSDPIDISVLNPGVYMVKMMTTTEVISQKLMKI